MQIPNSDQKENCTLEFLDTTVREYINFYNTKRPHQGLDNKIPFPTQDSFETGKIICIEKLGGLLNSYERTAS